MTLWAGRCFVCISCRSISTWAKPGNKSASRASVGALQTFKICQMFYVEENMFYMFVKLKVQSVTVQLHLHIQFVSVFTFEYQKIAPLKDVKRFFHQKSGCCGWLTRCQLQWILADLFSLWKITSRCSSSTVLSIDSIHLSICSKYSKYSFSTKFWVNTRLLFIACVASCVSLVSN